DLKPQFDAKDAVLCGVSFDSVDDNRAFREKFGFPYSLLCDTDKALSVACGAAADAAAGYPKRITVVVDPAGVVANVYEEVKPAEHPQQVLDAL
ncbi:MAG: redoxin domain-containing protein, partial [Planctomycetota bacterium]|nr:redoxin domain-containing protein [Planctomycetota bacterium]